MMQAGHSSWDRLRTLAAAFAAAGLLGCVGLPNVASRPPLDGGAPQGISYFDLEILHPARSGGRVTAAPWIEVQGRTGTAELFDSDVVLALDFSNTALLSSGFDVDGDGITGEDVRLAKRGDKSGDFKVSHRRWTSDRDDTILRSEIEAARTVVTALSERRNRIGLLTFTDWARMRTPVGAPGPVLAQLDRLRPYLDRNGTHMGAALRKAHRMLKAPSLASHPRRDRVILLFTDGRPTQPGSKHFASAVARRAAAEISGEGTRIVVLTFSELDERAKQFIDEFVVAASGVHVAVNDPRILLQDLPPVQLAPRALTITNLTTGRRARALRSTPQGDFGGFVPLAEGKNELQVETVLGNGRHVVEQRTLHYVPVSEPDAAERREAARLLLRLRERTKAIEAEAPEH